MFILNMTTWYYYSTQGSYYIWAATRTTCTVHTDYVPREGPCLTITRIYADRIEVGMVVSAYLPPCLLANGGYSCLHIDRLHFSKFYFVNKPLVKIPRKSSLLRPLPSSRRPYCSAGYKTCHGSFQWLQLGYSSL